MKKLMVLVLVGILALSLVGEALACCSPYDELVKRVNKANAQIEQYVRKAQKTPCDDVDWLLRKVDQTVKPVFQYAAKHNLTVVCEYVDYYVDGRWVSIDPLRVVNIGGSGSGKDNNEK